MNPLYYSDRSIKYDMGTYNNLSGEDKEAFPYYCPDKYPYLCTLLTDNFGLCKKSADDCESNIITESELLLSETEDEGMVKKGSQYGYTKSYLINNCGEVNLDLQQVFGSESPLNIEKEREVNEKEDQEDVLPTEILPLDISDDNLPEEIYNFSIMTYNIWGLVKSKDNPEYMKFLNDSMKLRMEFIVDIVKRNNPDFFCIQEMTNMSYSFLKDELSKIYPYAYEENFDIERNRIKRKRDVDVFVFSKYKPSTIKLYSVAGNLGYNNSFIILEFQNITIINCYLQAGSKYSPGQEPYWFHYSRCRKQELKSIGAIVDKYINNGKGCIMVGDFNCHLDGDLTEWPEIKEFDNMKMIDVWTKLRGEPGFTEDTDINQMRWNIKLQEKRLRFDGIFYRNPDDNQIVQPINIRITGRRPILLDNDMSNKFIKFFVPKVDNIEQKIRYFNKEKNMMALWPSDHFAVLATFNVMDEKIIVGESSGF